MSKFQIFTPDQPLSEDQKDRVSDFLVEQLGAFGDSKSDVFQCLAYAMTPSPHPGGLVIVKGEMLNPEGILVVNHTGMKGYIPEHILVYFAVSESMRGRGIGHEMLNFLLTRVQGGIALHVEADNPARKLYERLGFTNKYLEMRLSRE